jgi:hypothetical protein
MEDNLERKQTKLANSDCRVDLPKNDFVKSFVNQKSFMYVSLGVFIVLLTFVAFLSFRDRTSLVAPKEDKRSAYNAMLNSNKTSEYKPGEDRSGGNIEGDTKDAGSDTTEVARQEHKTNRFTVTYNKETFRNELKLGDDLIMTYNNEGGYGSDAECRTVRLPANPVINRDGSKVYFVDPKDGLPNQVKVMDLQKSVSVVYTAPSDYQFIASIVLGSNEKLAYTLFDRVPRSHCSNGRAADVDVRVMFVIDGKHIPGPTYTSSTPPEIVAFGKNYFVTRTNMMMVMTFCSGPEGVEIWRMSDNSSAYAAFGPLVHYDFENNHVFVYGEGGGCQKLYSSLKKVNLDTGDVEHIFGGSSFYIRVEQITQNSIVLKYLEEYDTTHGYPPFDKGKTFEYKFR